ncbi:hypothetical protein RJT34_13166 [Clitoria ternatea]|uniref:Beta-amylase n=1 Tax=Clitoria ternatea TaxID=43366 RepID=A0AAN9JN18_CLITE
MDSAYVFFDEFGDDFATSDIKIGDLEEKESKEIVDLTMMEEATKEASLEVAEFMKFGITFVCGGRRDMEDFVFIRSSFSKQGFHFFGVFYGHGCSHIARMCKDWLHEIVYKEIHKALEDVEWKSTMEKGFARMDDKVQTGICCGVVGEGETSTTIDPTSLCLSRHRTLDLLPLKLITDLLVPLSDEDSRKRPKLDLPSRDCKNVLSNSEESLATTRVKGMVIEIWWGLVERNEPWVYDWRGYRELDIIACTCGFKVRVIRVFHQHDFGLDDPN